ncbi:TPA: hypothetical protein ACOECQ_000818 [Stenotrophomonas maltophilia]
MARGAWIDIDAKGIAELAGQVSATPVQVEAAMRSTYGKLGRWARTQAVRGLSSKLGMQQKILRRRVRHFRLQNGVSTHGGAKVWFGMKPIRMSDLRPRRDGKGVRADGGHYVEGAFIRTINGKRKVFKRDGASRLPVREVTIDVSDPVQVYIEDHLIGSPEFEHQFFKFFEHELKWRTRTQT